MLPTLSLRTARLADLSAVDRLLARSYPRLLARDYPPSVLVTVVPRLVRARPELLASGRYYLVEDAGGALLGAGGWSLRPARAGAEPAAEMRHLATDPAALRRGVASAVLARVLAEARAAGARRIDCLSTLTAIPFYEASGFRRAGPAVVALAAGIDFRVERLSRPTDA